MAFENDAKRGVLNSYGVRTTKQKFGGIVDDDIIKTAAWTFSYDDLPVWTANKLELVIPAYAKILSARLEVITAFAGGTSYSVGLSKSVDGVAIDAAGLITAAQGALANINARGKFLIGTGALVGVAGSVDAAELTVTAVGAFTAGKARVVVQYLTEGA